MNLALSSLRLLTAALPLIAATGFVQAIEIGPQGMRFDSAGVLDLAERANDKIGSPLRVDTLDDTTAHAILAAADIAQERATLAFSDDLFGCAATAKQCVPQHEQSLIAAAHGAVRREGKRLTIKPANGAPAVFVDWKIPTTKTADGDEATHRYLGTLPGNGYHRVEAQFEHDTPGSFLVNPSNGRTAYVRNTADIDAASPDGLNLVTWNVDAMSLSLRVAALDAEGPRVTLQCANGVDDSRLAALFKGWRDANVFDIVLLDLKDPIPMRFTRGENGWRVAAAKPVDKLGFICRRFGAH
ncbi:MAG TPA: hypothetical protein VF132_08890 [Rudaea sp.]